MSEVSYAICKVDRDDSYLGFHKTQLVVRSSSFSKCIDIHSLKSGKETFAV